MTASPFRLDGRRVLVVGAGAGIGAATAALCERLGAHVTARDGAFDVGDVPLLDGCVFVAGASAYARIDALTPAHLEAVFAANVHAPLLSTQALLAAGKLARGASLVYVTSAAQHWAFGGAAAHAASNAALNAAVRALAVEQTAQGIRANCVAPGLVDDAPLDAAAPALPGPAPLGAIGVDDVAAGIAYLLAPASRWVSRTSLVIDGGLSLHVR